MRGKKSLIEQRGKNRTEGQDLHRCKIKGLRKSDAALIVVLAIIPFFLLGKTHFRSTHEAEHPMLLIRVDGEEFGTYDLSQDQTIEIRDGNTCRIRDGRAEMVAADCPDKICMNEAPIDAHGGSIVCLPNRVVLSVIDSKQEEKLDAIVK